MGACGYRRFFGSGNRMQTQSVECCNSKPISKAQFRCRLSYLATEFSDNAQVFARLPRRRKRLNPYQEIRGISRAFWEVRLKRLALFSSFLYLVFFVIPSQAQLRDGSGAQFGAVAYSSSASASGSHDSSLPSAPEPAGDEERANVPWDVKERYGLH